MRNRASSTVLSERLCARAGGAGLVLDPETAGRLAEYVELLLRWNRRVNLTALDDTDDGLDRLVIEPLLAARYVPDDAESAIDIGSGGGSPALPIKIARPGLFVRMVESRGRKSAFLREAVRRLGLADVVVESSRHEALRGRPGLREGHDVLTVRAVRVDRRVVDDLQGFVRPGGRMLVFGAAVRVGTGQQWEPPLVEEGRQRLLDRPGSQVLLLWKTAAG